MKRMGGHGAVGSPSQAGVCMHLCIHVCMHAYILHTYPVFHAHTIGKRVQYYFNYVYITVRAHVICMCVCLCVCHKHWTHG